MSKLQEIFSTLPVAVAWSCCDDSALSYVLKVLWTTSCFHILGHISYLWLWQAVSQLYICSKEF